MLAHLQPAALRRRGFRLNHLAVLTFVFVVTVVMWKRDWYVEYDADNNAVGSPIDGSADEWYDDGYDGYYGDYEEGYPEGEYSDGYAEGEAEYVEGEYVEGDYVEGEHAAADETPSESFDETPADADAAPEFATDPESEPLPTPESKPAPAPETTPAQAPEPEKQAESTSTPPEPAAAVSELRGHLVVASTTKDHLEWAHNIAVDNLEVIPYVADDPNAPFHPQANKGHEAMMYFQYMYDFYDDLPDYSIFTHGEEFSWHVEPIFNGSIRTAIEHLDLSEVVRRKYLNLRVSWQTACPDWIRTTAQPYNQFKTEEQFMYDAFKQNFQIEEVPEVLATPCCSQFALSRAAIRSVPREQYQFHMNWLLTTDLPDAISGRTWEHMFQWLFLQKGVDCPHERPTYCRAFHMCFPDDESFAEYQKIDQRLQGFKQRLQSLNGANRANGGRDILLKKIKADTELRSRLLDEALVLGKDEKIRLEIAPDLYDEELSHKAYRPQKDGEKEKAAEAVPSPDAPAQ